VKNNKLSKRLAVNWKTFNSLTVSVAQYTAEVCEGEFVVQHKAELCPMSLELHSLSSADVLLSVVNSATTFFIIPSRIVVTSTPPKHLFSKLEKNTRRLKCNLRQYASLRTANNYRRKNNAAVRIDLTRSLNVPL